MRAHSSRRLSSCVGLLLLLSTVQLAWSQHVDGSYTAAMMDLVCNSDLAFFPSNTAEVAAHIQTQVKAAAAAGTGLKVRASRRSFHSSAPFVCPGSSTRAHPGWDNKPVPIYLAVDSPSATSPASNVTAVSLLLDNMNKVVAVDKANNRLRVQAGMLITQLLQEASAAGMSVPLGAVPAFGDLTLGGVLAVGGHGSGFQAISSLGDLVVELTWVDGSGNVRTDSRDSEAGRALVGGLGAAGLITELLLQLQPPSSTAVTTRFSKPDSNLYADVLDMLKTSPHLLVVWRPDLRSYTGHMTQLLNGSVTGGCKMNNPDLPKFVAQGLGKAIELWQEDAHDLLAPVTVPPVFAAVREVGTNHLLAVNALGIPSKQCVGDTNKMQAISCGKKCLWSMGSKVAMDDIHFSIELDQLKAWIDDVQAIIAADLWQQGRKPFRFLAPGYFWLRFGRGTEDFISHTSGLKAPVHVQMSFMKSLAKGLSTSKYGWVLDVLEQLTMCKYKGKPHWGKNHARTFLNPSCPIRDNLPLWQRMEAFASSSDPNKIFQPQLFEQMAARAGNSLSPGCSTRGECFCTEDSHCAKGQQCLSSIAFPEYKACRTVGLL